MAAAGRSVSILFRNQLKATSLMPLVSRFRVADDMTKCFSVCVLSRSYMGTHMSSMIRSTMAYRLPNYCLTVQSKPQCPNCLSTSLFYKHNWNQQVMRIAAYGSETRVSGPKPDKSKPVLLDPKIDKADSRLLNANEGRVKESPGETEIKKPELSGSDVKAENAADKTTTASSAESAKTDVSATPEQQLTLFQRFHKAYKEHGKVLVAVHVATSIVWFGSFYFAARSGIDIVPLLEKWGFRESFIKPFRAGGLGDVALAYLMYKLATPARYTVTLGGTNVAIRYLRSKGRMAPKSQEDSIRELMKEGRKKLQDSNLRHERLKKLRELRKKKMEERIEAYRKMQAMRKTERTLAVKRKEASKPGTAVGKIEAKLDTGKTDVNPIRKKMEEIKAKKHPDVHDHKIKMHSSSQTIKKRLEQQAKQQSGAVHETKKGSSKKD